MNRKLVVDWPAIYLAFYSCTDLLHTELNVLGGHIVYITAGCFRCHCYTCWSSGVFSAGNTWHTSPSDHWGCASDVMEQQRVKCWTLLLNSSMYFSYTAFQSIAPAFTGRVWYRSTDLVSLYLKTPITDDIFRKGISSTTKNLGVAVPGTRLYLVCVNVVPPNPPWLVGG